MKYVVALIAGFIIGAALFALGMLYNPFSGDRGLSPLLVTDAEVITLNFSTVPTDGFSEYFRDSDKELKLEFVLDGIDYVPVPLLDFIFRGFRLATQTTRRPTSFCGS